MRETFGGHFTIKVSDLAKLSAEEWITCQQCDETFKSRDDLSQHLDSKHESAGYHTSAMKYNTCKNEEVPKTKTCINKVMTDLNTLINGAKEIRERKIIVAMKDVLEVCQKKRSKPCLCEQCENLFPCNDNIESHATQIHEDGSFNCEECEQTFLTNDDARNHAHQVHDNDFTSIQQEEYNDFVEFNQVLWDVLLCEDDANELTNSEKKEVLKLHKYFAHRNGRKLWENLFQPAGKMKGKKKHVLELLDGCDICKKYRKTTPRPKVGLPKARDVNDVVSLDLKIFKKGGNKEIGILYIHDEFSKLIKGQVINNKNKETISKELKANG